MTIACFIRYQIDPFQRDAFRKYAEAWRGIIPRCGGHLLGYFLPHEGTNDVAWGVIGFETLAAYETYRARLRADDEARGSGAVPAPGALFEPHARRERGAKATNVATNEIDLSIFLFLEKAPDPSRGMFRTAHGRPAFPLDRPWVFAGGGKGRARRGGRERGTCHGTRREFVGLSRGRKWHGQLAHWHGPLRASSAPDRRQAAGHPRRAHERDDVSGGVGALFDDNDGVFPRDYAIDPE